MQTEHSRNPYQMEPSQLQIKLNQASNISKGLMVRDGKLMAITPAKITVGD